MILGTIWPKRKRAIAAFAAGVSLMTSALLAPHTSWAEEKFIIGQTFLANGLDPSEGSVGWALVTHGIGEQLFSVSKQGKIEPNLAESAIENSDGTWTITLADNRFFSDGTPVTAKMVAAGFNRTGQANPSARSTSGLLSFHAVDERTLKVHSEKPTKILPSILAEWAFPVYMEKDGEFIFTGPFAVESLTADKSIDLVPNPHYKNAENRPELTIRRIPDGQSLALAFASGELDLAFNLPVESLSMFAGDEAKQVKSFPVAYQYMMWMNTSSDVLQDVRVRKAIDMAINREDLVAAARAGTVATGAFSRTYPFAAEKELPFDVNKANALLDEAGWIKGEDGVRRKNGQPMQLVLWAYPQRPDLITFQPVIRAALAGLGISVKTQVTESPTDIAKNGAFDLFLWAQHTAPAGDPAQFLSLFLETDAANNYARWSNAEYDAVIEKLRAEGDTDVRTELARKAQEIIATEAPVSFLVTPEWHMGVSDRLKNYEPWGSDYYIIRPDLQVSK
jgi:peptide/nickel transport system substrate-binding protein